MSAIEALPFLPERQQALFLHPEAGINEDLKAIYRDGKIEVGWPIGARRIFEHLARPASSAVVGVDLGDEGKGRVIDNTVQKLLGISGVKAVNVIRFSGGNNAGHSVEAEGVRLALSLVPSGVMHKEVIGIMDRGMVIHPDLQAEVAFIEDCVGDTRGKLILSPDAILATDLERAEEVLNRTKQGKATGGTGRGIGPSAAHHYDRLGFHVSDLMEDDWRKKFEKQYKRYEKEFAVYGMNLAEMNVPDYEASKRQGKPLVRKVGLQEEYLDRLEAFRTWLIERRMVENTFLIHRMAYNDLSMGILFEGAQALGLHPWLGTRPDVTSTDPSIYGIHTGTGFWKAENIAERIGVFKISYTSSVGARHMPTQVELGRDIRSPDNLQADATPQQKWAAFVREEADEFGTITRRPRDILHLDLEMMRYNCRMAGVEVLAGTHLDIARDGENIRVCTHYTKDGEAFPYQPGLKNLEGVKPHYVELPGWDGEAVRKAKSFDELPENAKKFLAFIQRRTGYPIVIATTGPDRDHYLDIPPFPPQETIYAGVSLN